MKVKLQVKYSIPRVPSMFNFSLTVKMLTSLLKHLLKREGGGSKTTVPAVATGALQREENDWDALADDGGELGVGRDSPQPLLRVVLQHHKQRHEPLAELQQKCKARQGLSPSPA